MYILVITGSRKLSPEVELRRIFTERTIDLVITGDAQGVDKTAYKLATELKIPVIASKAWWSLYDKAAGHMRNSDMVHVAALFRALGAEVYAHAFPASDSVGTHNCIQQLGAAGIPGMLYDVPLIVNSYLSGVLKKVE